MATTSSLSLTSTVNVGKTGLRMPVLGFGVYLSPPEVTKASCLTALKTGYRHIDTGQYYENEAEVGRAVRESGLRRDEVFLTTKILFATDAENDYRLCVESVHKLDNRRDGYVDLFLIHAATVGSSNRKMLWSVLERLYHQGKAKAIGVSNWGPSAIEELREIATVWPPHVNQLELHPWNQQRITAEYCAKHDIVLQAYAPMARNQKAADPTLVAISERLGKATTQVMIRYCLQKGWVPLPKSDNPDRIRQNADVFSWHLSDDDFARLDAVGSRGDSPLVRSMDVDEGHAPKAQ